MLENFGTHQGRAVRRALLQEGETRIAILNYGCVTQDWRVGGRSVVLGFDNFADYPAHSRSFGIIAGRVANRTALGRFHLAGRAYQLPTNNGAHHLHGGDVGLGRRLWDMDVDSAGQAVQLRYVSPDGEEGYPGRVEFVVTVSLQNGQVTYDMQGLPDRPTPINLAQHNYYNLGGADVLAHHLQIAASRYTPVDDGLIPLGPLETVAGTRLDFRDGAVIGEIDPERKGIDLNLVLDRHDGPAVVAECAETGLRLQLWTDEPGLQLFNAPNMSIAVPGHDGTTYGAFAGFCLEAQKFPDSLNRPEYPSIIASPERPYQQRLVVEIG